VLRQAGPTSELVVALTESSRWSDFGSKLSELSAAAEWGKAEADGVVRPSKKGVDKDYDAAQEAVEAAEQELQVRKQQEHGRRVMQGVQRSGEGRYLVAGWA
jgi:hypothetical protein